MNINEGNVGSGSGPGSSNADWIHINAIDYNESLDQIAISSRFMSEIYIIDHSTTIEEAASHEGGNCGKGGDFYIVGETLKYIIEVIIVPKFLMTNIVLIGFLKAIQEKEI